MCGRTILYLLPLSFILFCYPIEKVNFNKRNQLHINLLILFSYFCLTNFRVIIDTDSINKNFTTYTTGGDYYNVLKNIDIPEKAKILLIGEQIYIFESLYTRHLPPYKKYKIYNTKDIQLDKSDIIIMYYPIKSYLPDYILEQNFQDIAFLEDIMKKHCNVLLTGKYATLIKCKIK